MRQNHKAAHQSYMVKSECGAHQSNAVKSESGAHQSNAVKPESGASKLCGKIKKRRIKVMR